MRYINRRFTYLLTYLLRVRVRTRDVFSRTIGLANLWIIDTEPS